MARPRQPIQLVLANGKKHLTKAEIEDRMNSEPVPRTDDLTAPAYLSAAEKKRYNKIREQLSKLKVMGETDTETLARYVTAQCQYEKASKELRDLMRQKPSPKDEEYLSTLGFWVDTQEKLAKLQDRFFKQAQSAATALGLTISARCKLVVPKAPEEPKPNKFARFNQGAG